ncbi:GyrI-like domain-containing protein [Pseudonocardia nematodicida]|uniref:GyrI-like domain-containing protein n=1 Tax=Pseudonocardia nematodicida TaxID=1206997 RepID=A0ABV1K997_9PSEU
MPDKVDLKRTLPCYRARRDTPELVDVPDLRYLMLDGHGDPNTAAWTDAVSTLFPAAYRLKAAARRELGRDHVVMPLEALWWADDMASFTDARDKSRWHWTVMIMQPDWIEPGMVTGGPRLETLSEGRCVQALHVGPYDDEAALIRRMHDGIGPDLRLTGRHHEIYLSDPRRVEPAKLRTILRQPVAPA